MTIAIAYPLTPDNLNDFNTLVEPEGWGIAELRGFGESVFAEDSGSTFSKYQLEAIYNENGGELVEEWASWDDLVRHLRDRAAEGSRPHQEALKFFEKYTPKEWRYISKVTENPETGSR